MRRFLLSLLLPLCLLGVLLADHVEIPQEHRRLNKGGNDCVWNSLTALCRLHGYQKGFGLDTPPGKGTSGPGAASAVLKRLGIPYKEVFPGRKDTAFLREYVAEKKYGCLVGLGGRHAVVCVHFDEQAKTAAILDNCGPYACKVEKMSLSTFLSRWDGWAVVILPSATPDGELPERPAPGFLPADEPFQRRPDGVPLLPPIRRKAAPAAPSLPRPQPDPNSFEDSPAPIPATDPRQTVGIIRCPASRGNGTAQGSGTVIGPRRADGRQEVLTAAHCLEQGMASRISFELKDGRKFVLRPIAYRPDYDIAWLETVDPLPADLPYSLLADGDPAAGARVWHCGYSSIEADRAKDRQGVVGDEQYFRSTGGPAVLDARVPCYHGDSGGALFDEHGRVCGVVTNGVGSTPFPAPFQGAARRPYPRTRAALGSDARKVRPFRLPGIRRK